MTRQPLWPRLPSRECSLHLVPLGSAGVAAEYLPSGPADVRVLADVAGLENRSHVAGERDYRERGGGGGRTVQGRPRVPSDLPRTCADLAFARRSQVCRDGVIQASIERGFALHSNSAAVGRRAQGQRSGVPAALFFKRREDRGGSTCDRQESIDALNAVKSSSSEHRRPSLALESVAEGRKRGLGRAKRQRSRSKQSRPSATQPENIFCTGAF